MRLTYFTKYSRKGASSRLRSFQYEPYLYKLGVIPVFYPLFTDSYIEAIYNHKVPLLSIIGAYLKRMWRLIKLDRHEFLFIEKELFPFMPFFIERMFYKKGQKLVLDYDDAIFHNYDQNKNGIVKFFLKKKIDKLMSISDLVIVCNEYLKSRAVKAGARKVVVIPTVVDLNHYERKNEPVGGREIIIGWIGSPTTFSYLKNIHYVLERAVNELGVVLHIIGAKESLGIEENVRYFEWSEQTESTLIHKIDIGLMPLENSSWARGKCAYKLIQYMVCGKPVIASPVGMNKIVVRNGVNGFLADSNDEWFEAIRTYVNNKELITVHGLNGFERVEKDFNLNVCSSQLYKALSIINNENHAS